MHRSPSYDYAEFLPGDYDNDPDQTFPLIIALHGVGGETLAADRSAIYSSPEGLAKQKAFDAAGDPVPDVNGRHICDMKQLPILAVHGTQDGHSLTRAYRSVDYQNIMNVKCSPTYPKMLLRLIVGGLHTGSTWDTAYADSRTYDWLFAQRASDKADPATHSAPVVTPSANQTVTLPIRPGRREPTSSA